MRPKVKKISFPRLFTARRRAGVFRGPSGAFHLVAAPALEKFIISQWGFDIVGQGSAVAARGARAMGYSFIGSYQSASGALPLCDPRPSGASGLFRASFYAFHSRGGGEVSSTSKPPLKGGKCVRP